MTAAPGKILVIRSDNHSNKKSSWVEKGVWTTNLFICGQQASKPVKLLYHVLGTQRQIVCVTWGVANPAHFVFFFNNPNGPGKGVCHTHSGSPHTN